MSEVKSSTKPSQASTATTEEQKSAPGNEEPSSSPISSYLKENKLPVFLAAYLLTTSLAFLRISRQPFSASRKWEQYETVFKGTTLAGVIGWVAVSGGINQRRSEYLRKGKEGSGG